MSEAAAHTHVSSPADSDAWESVLTRIQRPALLVGLIGLAVTVIGLIATPESALKSYLWAFLYWCAIPLGSLCFLMIQHMTGGAWGLVARRFFEAAASLIVVMAVLSLPVLIAVAAGYYKLYPWINIPGVHEAHLGHFVNEDHIAFKRLWLSPWFFILRTVIYFSIWSFLALFLYSWSGKEDRRGSTPEFRFGARRIAAPGLLIGPMAVVFFMLDWIMSLDPSWYSTMFGVLYLVGSGLMTMSFTVVVLRIVGRRNRQVNELLTWQTLNDLGNLMFAFTLLWAYTNFSQFLIMWSGNIAEETPYYYVRKTGSWGAVALIVVFCHFFIPFLLLLWRKIKRDLRLLAMVALGVMAVRSVDLFWIIKPMFIQREYTALYGTEHGGGHGHGGDHKEAAKDDKAHAAPAAATPAESHPAPGGADPAQEAGHVTPQPTQAPAIGDPDAVKALKRDVYHFPVKGLSYGIQWTDPFAFIGIGGILIGAYAWRLKQRPLIAANDPRLPVELERAHGHH